MPYYLLQGRYASGAIKAMVASPSDRRKAASEVIAAAGGTLHQFFFAFGKYDFVAVIEAPDDVAMASGLLAVGASGALDAQATTKLMTAEEAMDAMRRAGDVARAYTPPGS